MLLAAPSSPTTPPSSRRAALTFLVLAWLVGVNLRTVLLAVPPVLPLIRQDLDLSYTATGLLTSLPILLLGLAAVPGAYLIARTSARAAVALGLILLAAGALLRALTPTAFPIFAFTALLSIGIAICQPAFSVLVRQLFPKHIGTATGIYSNGLIIGEIVAASLTLPALNVLGKDNWRGTFVLWGIPIIATLVLWLLFAPRTHMADTIARARWQAGWKTWRGWHLGLLLGAGSLVYFSANTWIPNYDKALGRPETTSSAELFVLNAMQLPVSILVTVFAGAVLGRRWPMVLSGIACVLGTLGWLFLPATSLFWVGLTGAGSSTVFLLSLGLPAFLAPERDVAGYTGLMLTLGYTSAFLGPLIGGGLWDISGIPGFAFIPILIASVFQMVFGMMLPRQGEHSSWQESEATK
ncbi:MAG TPA: MFS transporter [Ktedonobacterales bacterium]|jgi:CP family cyanate transporter-like MFS transporter